MYMGIEQDLRDLIIIFLLAIATIAILTLLGWKFVNHREELRYGTKFACRVSSHLDKDLASIHLENRQIIVDLKDALNRDRAIVRITYNSMASITKLEVNGRSRWRIYDGIRKSFKGYLARHDTNLFLGTHSKIHNHTSNT